MNQIILKFSLNDNKGSKVRNDIAGILKIAGFAGYAEHEHTGTWKVATGATTQHLSAAKTALDILTSPMPNGATLDSVWFYVD